MFSEAFLKRVLMFIGVILSGLITLIFVATPAPFDVPVPDELPPITTKSSQIAERTVAEDFFDNPVADTIRGATVSAITSWSGNGKYVLADMKIASTDGTTKTQAYVLDLIRRLYVAVPNANWIDTAAWSGTKLLYKGDTGYSVFDIATGETYTFGSADLFGMPVFSLDGTKVAYSDHGLVVYNLARQKNIRLSSNEGDIPMLWDADGRTLLFVKETKTGVLKKDTVYMYDFNKKTSTELTDLDKPYKQATWLVRDESALLTLGSDDGNFEYLYTVATGEKKFITETSEGRAFLSTQKDVFATVVGKTATVYSKTMEVLAKSTLTTKGDVRSITLLPNERLAVVIGTTQAASTVILVDMKTKTETKMAEISLPYVFSSPDGMSLATVAADNSAAQFISVPRE